MIGKTTGSAKAFNAMRILQPVFFCTVSRIAQLRLMTSSSDQIAGGFHPFYQLAVENRPGSVDPEHSQSALLRQRAREIDGLPGQPVAVQFLHERIGIELLHVEDARPVPILFEHQHRPDHGRDAGGVGYRLGLYFLKGLGMIADIVGIALLLLSVL